ncbi:MAG: hypothetical protein DRJ42_26330 [Deltaproteobacteria bacterium]|nr:MAG: hypothetical protein DRJ42_26330 [Deltaproteobacteria bacterium]
MNDRIRPPHTTLPTWALAALLMMTFAASAASADDPPAAPRLLTHPDGPGELEGRVALGLSIDIAPTLVVEGAPRRIPTIELDTRLGLPEGFSVLAELRTQVVTTWLLLGPSFSFEAGPVGLMVGYLAKPYFGWLGQFGFETLSWGISNVPVVRAGLHFGKVHLTLEVGAEISFGRWARLGSSVVAESQGVSYLGAHAMITVENELGNGGLLIYRVGLLTREGSAVLWAAFSDETAHLLYPRIEVTYAF